MTLAEITDQINAITPIYGLSNTGRVDYITPPSDAVKAEVEALLAQLLPLLED